MESVVARLEERIEQLSAQSRRQRAWLIALSTILVGIGLAAARDPDHDVVRPRRFEAVDEKGRIVAVLASQWKWGTPALALLEDDGDAFAFLTRMGVGMEGATEKKKVVILELDSLDAASDDDGVTKLGAMPGGGFLNLSHGDDEGIALAIAEQGMGFRIAREEQPPLLEFRATADDSVLQIHDGKGKSLLRVP